MSYNIRLIDSVSKDTIHLSAAHQMSGGTFAVGGTTEASLNITYNYSAHYYRIINGGIRAIYGMSGATSLPLLDHAIASLGDKTDPDYWQPTEGNAKRALIQLRTLAQLRPDGIWEGD